MTLQQITHFILFLCLVIVPKKNHFRTCKSMKTEGVYIYCSYSTYTRGAQPAAVKIALQNAHCGSRALIKMFCNVTVRNSYYLLTVTLIKTRGVQPVAHVKVVSGYNFDAKSGVFSLYGPSIFFVSKWSSAQKGWTPLH